MKLSVTNRLNTEYNIRDISSDLIKDGDSLLNVHLKEENIQTVYLCKPSILYPEISAAQETFYYNFIKIQKQVLQDFNKIVKKLIRL